MTQGVKSLKITRQKYSPQERKKKTLKINMEQQLRFSVSLCSHTISYTATDGKDNMMLFFFPKRDEAFKGDNKLSIPAGCSYKNVVTISPCSFLDRN